MTSILTGHVTHGACLGCSGSAYTTACSSSCQYPATSHSHWRGVDQHPTGHNQQPDQLNAKEMCCTAWGKWWCTFYCGQPKGAFTPYANEVLSASYLYVKSMQRHDRQSCDAIHANEAARTGRFAQITWREFSVRGVWRAIHASWKIWTMADIHAAWTNQELALAVTWLRAEAENPKQQWRTN